MLKADTIQSIGPYPLPRILELIRWLLEQNLQIERKVLYELLSFDYDTVLSARDNGYCEGILQIFVHDLDGFEENMDLLEFARIWRRCGSLAGLEVLLQRFDRFVQALPAVERLRFFGASLNMSESAASYIAKIDHCRGIPSFDRFYQNDGALVLHHVAAVLGADERTSDWEAWTRIGVTAIQCGADLHAIKQHASGRPYTPLLLFIDTTMPRTSFTPVRAVGIISSSLKRWTHMLDEAKVDLPAYFLRESEVCTSIDASVHLSHITRCGPGMCLVAPRYDSSTQGYHLRIRREIHLPLMRLHHLPGRFECLSRVPNKICWEPSRKESEEGHWIQIATSSLRGRTMSLHEFNREDQRVSHLRLVDSSQDDNGILMRMLCMSTSSHPSRKRCSSEPAPLYRRQYDYGKPCHSPRHPWLHPIDFCTEKSTWIVKSDLSCMRWHLNIARSCVNGHGQMDEMNSPVVKSFLHEIVQCQHGTRLGLGLNRKTGIHYGTPQCPEGCGKINLSILPIPQDLPNWHPGRRVSVNTAGPEDLLRFLYGSMGLNI
jgi:hypothetical protein